MKKATRTAAFAFCALVACATSLSAFDRPSLPTPSAAYGIGRVSYEMIDSSRPEPQSPRPGAHRRMMVYVWYPTDKRSMVEKATAPYLPGFDDAQSKVSPRQAGKVPGALTSPFVDSHAVRRPLFIRPISQTRAYSEEHAELTQIPRRLYEVAERRGRSCRAFPIYYRSRC
jgi:hypothetical protein